MGLLLWWRRSVALRSGGQDQSLGLDWNWERHWNGSLRLGWRLVLSGHWSSWSTIAVNGSSLWGTILIIAGYWSWCWRSLGTVITVSSRSSSSMISVMMMVTTLTITSLGKHLGQLTLLGNLIFKVFS